MDGDIDWLINYLQELKAEGETHVFALIYDRNDANGYFYGYNSDKQVSKDAWQKVTASLSDRDWGLGDDVGEQVHIEMVSRGETPTY